MTRHCEIPSLFHILTSFVHMTYHFARRQAVSWAVNGSRRFRDCLTLPILHKLTQISEVGTELGKTPGVAQRSLGNFNCQSETPRLNVSNVIFAINGAYKYYKYIKRHVLRCTTIGFKQKYGHRSSRRADMNMNLRSKSVFFTAEIGQYWAVET